MGKNLERLGRLQANRTSIAVIGVQTGQVVMQTAAQAATTEATTSIQKAARTEGFGGEYGVTVAEALTIIRADLDKFADYQAAVSTAFAQATQALQDTANGVTGLPDAGLTPAQQETIAIHSATNSPVHVQPGVTMTPAEAQQYYLDQAAAAQEEQAAKLAAALDARLQEIIDGMPTSDYDPPKPPEDPSGDDETGGDGSGDYPGVTGGTGPGGSNDTGGGGGGGGGYVIGHPSEPHLFVDPPYDPDGHDDPVYDPPVHDPRFPHPDDDGTDDPNVDGNVDGEVPGVRPGGNVPGPGGSGGGGAGTVGGALGGLAGGVGLAAGGAALARRLNGGAGLLAGVGGVGGVGAGGVGGAGGAGASGVVAAQPGGATGGRGGMVGGAAAGGGAGGGRGKRNRRRGQDLMAFEVEPDDDEAVPDIGEAGAAGRSTSEGREEITW